MELSSRAYRELAPKQRAQIWIGGPGMVQPELLFETGEVLIEAPNWSLDSAALFVNGHGVLWRVDLGSTERGLVRID
ncbi:MAG TPA: biopolymer transporter Tol, partial [Propionibacteriaceae bacterium]|nr:biopolymer transporter Tol [Propionibacteriaceae bacterium]